MDNIKKILYSDVIVELIMSTKVLAIFLGGSRLYNLNSPESDYDIIIITSDDRLGNYNKQVIDLPFNAHIFINPISKIIQSIKDNKSSIVTLGL